MFFLSILIIMPYRKRGYGKRKRVHKRKSGGKSGWSLARIANTAGKALKTATYLASLLNVEEKYCDNTNNWSLGTGSYVWYTSTLFASVPQGVTANTRTGE